MCSAASASARTRSHDRDADHGLQDALRSLRDLPQRVQEDTLKRAVSAGAEVVRAEAALRAPRYSGKVGKDHPPAGTLKASIYKAAIPEECTATRETWKVDVRKRAYYAHMVEFGTVKMAARPFMRPAFDAKQAEVVEVMRTKIAAAIATLKAA